MGKERIRILIVDDHIIVRKGLAMMLRQEPDFEVAGDVENGRKVLELVGVLHPHLVLLDLIMPEMDGVATAMALRSMTPHVHMLVLTGVEMNNGFPKILARVLAAGVQSYVPKSALPHELCHAIRVVARGDRYIHPTVEQCALCRVEPQWESLEQSDPHLTPREQEILHWMATPATYREIAGYLSLSEETVRSHAKSILNKMHKPNRSQAVLEAVRSGYIKLSR